MGRWPFFPLTASRYLTPQIKECGLVIQDPCALFFGHQAGVGWRFVVQQTGFALVGQTYHTKDELLNDLPRYAATWGLT